MKNAKIFKIILCGDSNVGRRTFLEKYTQGVFEEEGKE